MDKERLLRLLQLRFKPKEKVRSNLPMVIPDPTRSKLAYEVALTVLHKEKDKIPSEDPTFLKNLRIMGDAIDIDPIQTRFTEDLGFSQALRLKSFLNRVEGKSDKNPKVEMGEPFSKFPTIGGEFHITLDEETYDTFWQRVAYLNMSQYQEGSEVPYSKSEHELIEVRMNPSIYPVSISTWHFIRRILPEMSSSFFTITLGKRDEDLDVLSEESKELVRSLQTLANITYASFFKSGGGKELPGELSFGGFYIGQTIRVKEGIFTKTGDASKSKGQLNLYSGFSHIFPQLARYTSFAFVEPEIREFLNKYLGKGIGIEEAFNVPEDDFAIIWRTIDKIIDKNRTLQHADKKATEIMDRLAN